MSTDRLSQPLEAASLLTLQSASPSISDLSSYYTRAAASVQLSDLDTLLSTSGINLSSAGNVLGRLVKRLSSLFNPPTPALSVQDASVTESSSTLTFTVNLSAASTQAIAVDFATQDGTALAGADYTATNGRLTFAAGQTSQTIAIPIVGDSEFELDEGFFLNLSNATNATIADGQGAGTIINDDLRPIPTIALTEFVTGFSQPVDLVNAGDGSGRLFVVEQAGQIRIVQGGTVQNTPFLDIRDRVLTSNEQGLLSLAFPSDYAAKRRFYVYYTNPSGNLVLSRFQLQANSEVGDPASEQVLFSVPHPTYTNHNGGKLAFGPDGYLYVGLGDGGGSGDPLGNAQNPATLLGKLLRLDVESPGVTTYAIPSSNPFTAANDPSDRVRDEIWASGLRNPWRISFDRQTGDLYIADVGERAREEVNLQPVTSRGGENYGWNISEGTLPFSSGDSTGFTLPLVEYDHSQGRSITGGYVYRGAEYAGLQGAYVYGDFITGRIWGVRRTQTGVENKLLLDSPYNLSTFGEDQQGNLYAADFRGGIYRITVPT